MTRNLTVTETRYPTKLIGVRISGDLVYQYSNNLLGRPDGVQARFNQTSGTPSQITVSDFDFTIPDNASITSIGIRWTAQNDDKSPTIKLISPDGLVYGSVTGKANIKHIVSATLTPLQLREARLEFHNVVDYYTYTYVDAMDIEVTYVDPNDRIQMAVDLWAKSIMPNPDTNINSYSGGPAYLSEAKFLGPTDGVVAQAPTSNVSQWILTVKMDDLVLPDNARVEEVYFRAVTGASVAGTLFMGPNTTFTTQSFGSGVVNNTSPWYKINSTPTRDELIGDNYMQLRFGSPTNRKEIDSLITTVIYSIPAPTGPEVKHYNGTSWQNISGAQQWSGSAWQPLEMKAY